MAGVVRISSEGDDRIVGFQQNPKKSLDQKLTPKQSHAKFSFKISRKYLRRITGLRCSRPTYCWFSHDVTKIQTKKLSILPRFYFHDALEQLKTNFHRKFRFKRVLGFVIEDA